MANFRSVIILALLAAFFAWYGVSWAYQSLYREPRRRLGDEIAKYGQGLDKGRNDIAMMQQIVQQNQMLYYRSMPRVPNDVLTLYPFWFKELMKFCDIEDGDVNGDRPGRLPFGSNYRFHVRATTTLDQLSRMLFEFYNAPFLQRITAMSITPVEGAEDRVSLSMTVDTVSVRQLYPQAQYPLVNQLPVGHLRRQAANELQAYQVIAQRNLLQAAKGGVDRADYTYLTAINLVDNRMEIWLTIRTDNRIVKAGKGDTVQIGSFFGEIIDITDQQDVVFERNGMRWLVSLGDCLNQAFALPRELY